MYLKKLWYFGTQLKLNLSNTKTEAVLKSVVNLSLTECQNTTVLLKVSFKLNFSLTRVKLELSLNTTQVLPNMYNFST